MNNLALKHKVFTQCREIVEDKIVIAKKAVEAAKQAANQEERSTAGDKYDTARAMSHIDQDMYGKQLTEVLKLAKSLDQISIENKIDHVKLGAMVNTSNGVYFIASGIGLINVEGQNIMVISAIAPIAQQLLDKKTGDQVIFNGKKITIEEVC